MSPDDVALMVYTSGTTTHPRGCPLTHRAVVSTGVAVGRDRFRCRPEDVLWDVLPLSHLSFLHPLIAILDAGGSFATDRRFDPATALALIRDAGVTVAFTCFPTVIDALLARPEFGEVFARVRLMLNVGPPDTLRAIQARAPHTVQLTSYGSSEMSGIAATTSPDDPDDVRLGTNGRPLPGMEMAAMDLADDVLLPAGETGEIVVRGIGMFAGYWDDPEATARCHAVPTRPAGSASSAGFHPPGDGWLRSGDLGLVDAEGRVHYRGRLKDMIKVGGENVAALEVEAVLAQHPDVAGAAVVAAPDPRFTEVPAAFVELRADAHRDRRGPAGVLRRVAGGVQGPPPRPLHGRAADVRNQDPEGTAAPPPRRGAGGIPGEGVRMKTKGALLWEPGTNSGWSVEEIEIDPPKEREVMVKLAASGVCHSDNHLDDGVIPLPWAPVLGGHEGAGVVTEVGPGVTDVGVGDHVVLSFLPSCGKCQMCVSGRSNMCALGGGVLAGTAPDGTHRVHTRSKGVGCMSYLGTFAPYVCAPLDATIKIEKDIPLDKAALIGCGVPTGWGSSVYAADMQIGDTVVIVGIGGVGINAVQGARLKGAKNIIAIDPVPYKQEAAQQFGATHAVSNYEEAATLVEQLTNGQGADRVILTVGVMYGELLEPAQAMTRRGGVIVMTSAAPILQRDVQVDLFTFAMSGKRLQGSLYGTTNSRNDVPLLCELYRSGQLMLDELVTRTYPLEDINQAFRDMQEGKNLRGVIMYD